MDISVVNSFIPIDIIVDCISQTNTSYVCDGLPSREMRSTMMSIGMKELTTDMSMQMTPTHRRVPFAWVWLDLFRSIRVAPLDLPCMRANGDEVDGRRRALFKREQILSRISVHSSNDGGAAKKTNLKAFNKNNLHIYTYQPNTSAILKV